MEPVERHHLEIVLDVDARSVSHVRKLVGSWIGDALDKTDDALDEDDDVAWRAELATSELMENIVRSARTRTARLCVSVLRDREFRRIIVSSNNRATPEAVAEVKRAIAELHRTTNAVAHYEQLMRDTATREHDSALALARIRAEAEMELESFAYRGEVTVVARATFNEQR